MTAEKDVQVARKKGRGGEVIRENILFYMRCSLIPSSKTPGTNKILQPHVDASVASLYIIHPHTMYFSINCMIEQGFNKCH